MKQRIEVALSFDDGLLDQFKWARALYRYRIKGTFYICPFYIGNIGHLNADQLKQMHDEWGHVIANHFWLHEAPRGSKQCNDAVGDQVLIRNMLFAAEWLDKNGFDDGKSLVALPFGSAGGGWSKALINNLLKFCDQIRDVGSGVNKKGSRILTAMETTDLINAPDNSLVCYYFHGNHNTADQDLINLLNKLVKSDVKFTSMLEEAQNV